MTTARPLTNTALTSKFQLTKIPDNTQGKKK
jgi:hypothetical protein